VNPQSKAPAVPPAVAAAWAAWADGVRCVRVTDRRGAAHKQWVCTLDRAASTLVGRSAHTAAATTFVQQTTTSAYYFLTLGLVCQCFFTDALTHFLFSLYSPGVLFLRFIYLVIGCV
jgi:hypothetical protein